MLKKIIALTLLLSLLPIRALADDGSAVYLPKTSPAPFAGYLISPDTATKVRLMKIDNDELTKTNVYLQQDNDLYVKRLDNMKDYNDKLASENVSLRENSIWSKLGFFLLGAAVTTGIAFGVSRATR